jgi:PhzF family phenazine biosynthesis protein
MTQATGTDMRQWTVDAFASAPFKGNPACVLEPLNGWPETARMQALAAENNQAETAFLLRTPDPARFGLRWFTPALEVPLCGHATLASAHVLYAELGGTADAITFDTLSGPLIVARADGGYRMDFPATPPHRIEPPAGLCAALGASPREVWAAQYVVAVLESEDAVRNLRPDLPQLEKAAAAAASRGLGNVGVSALASPGAPYDVVSRFFAPGSGISEDPTTGSLHCILAPLFSEKLGRARLRYHQAYPGRGGDLVCELNGERVLIAGAAVTVLESRLRLAL